MCKGTGGVDQDGLGVGVEVVDGHHGALHLVEVLHRRHAGVAVDLTLLLGRVLHLDHVDRRVVRTRGDGVRVLADRDALDLTACSSIRRKSEKKKKKKKKKKVASAVGTLGGVGESRPVGDVLLIGQTLAIPYLHGAVVQHDAKNRLSREAFSWFTAPVVGCANNER